LSKTGNNAVAMRARLLPLSLALGAGALLVVFGIGRLVREAARAGADRPPARLLGSAAAPTRLCAATSPFNLPIPADAQVDPNSALLVQSLADAVHQGSFLVAVGRWTVPVYVAGPKTPRYRVALTADWAPAHMLAGVPIPPGARPDPAGDGHLAILDRRSGCEYDLWKAKKVGRTWTAGWANSLRTTESGVYPRGLSARGSGFALLGGMIWPDELARGTIDHVLIFSYPSTALGFVSPASESDGVSGRPEAIPEGARLQLDPSLDLDSLMLPPYERTIARALQRYGMYLADNGSPPSLYAINPQSYGRNPYAGILPGGPYVELNGIPVDRFRVLARGPLTRAARSELVPSGCGAFR
jgi:hypothetical protein